jgi:16S rRNA (guanine527-N7)-methyltransferase
MKGRVPDDELQALPDTIDVFHVERLSVPDLDAQRCLVWMREKFDSPAIPAPSAV